MEKMKFAIPALALFVSSMALQSCDNGGDDYVMINYPTAVVTVCPEPDGGFTMRLDKETTLYPTNVDKSPYGDKEVRALVNFTPDETAPDNKGVHVNWLDSIRTKLPAVTLGELDDKTFGNDPVEIVRDWVTVAEDGYLTLRLRTVWGPGRVPHHISLLTGINPDDPFELELRHDAKGDIAGEYGDALIAFNLNNLSHDGDGPVKVKLHWKSFSGKKSAEFDLEMRQLVVDGDAGTLVPASMVR